MKLLLPWIPSSEQYVQKTINILRERNKTIVLIAHRLSTVYNADNICVLEKGKLVEEGNHQELMRHKGIYHNLWKQQFPMMGELTTDELIVSEAGDLNL